MATDDRAIIVGVQSYPDLGDLGGPENDAKAFYDWLRSPIGGDVPDDHVELILSSKYNPPFLLASQAEPTPIRVQQAFDHLLDIADDNSRKGEGLRVGRRLYIYLAGHGFAPRFDQAALLMANATKRRVGYHILGKLYAHWFFLAGYFDEIVLFMDCCRESYPQAPLNVPPYMDVTAPDAIDKGKLFYGFGTKWSRLSRERMMGDGLVRGVFTTALLEGLKGAACDPNGRVTAASLGDYLYNNMKKFLAPMDFDDPDVPKEPDLDYDPHIGSSFVFANTSPKFLVAIHLPAGSAGKKVEILGDKFTPVASTTAVPPVWQLVLERGTYLAQIVEDGLQKIVEVSGTEGVVNVNL